MKRQQEPVSPSQPEKSEPERTDKRPRFQRPRVRRLGTLPAVTTAFGGSFTP